MNEQLKLIYEIDHEKPICDFILRYTNAVIILKRMMVALRLTMPAQLTVCIFHQSMDPFLYSHVRCACMHAFCIYYYTGSYTNNLCMCASTTWAKCLHSQAIHAIHAIHAATNTSRSIQATFPLLQHGFPNHFLHFIIALIIHILHQIHDPSRRIFLRR